MGLFFKKKKAKMEIPPPPPPEGPLEVKEEKPPELPPMPEKHIPSEMPEIKPPAKEEKPEEKPPSMPEFPEIPKEEAKAAEKIERPVAPAETAGPRFVKISSFQTVLTKADEIRSSLKKAENVILKLGELKNEEEKEFQKWRTQLEDTEKKLSYIDQVIFKGE